MKKLFTLFLLSIFTFGVVNAQDLIITGNFASAGGSDWSNNDANFRMTDNDGIYTLTKNFPAGSYEFKVVNNGSWGNVTTESNNHVFTLTEASDVTFYAKYSATQGDFRLSCNKEEFFIVGDPFGGWTDANRVKMTANPDNAKNEYYHDFPITDSNQSYKVVGKSNFDNIIWDCYMSGNGSLSDLGKYRIVYDYTNFTSTAYRIPESTENSFIYVGSDANNSTWYNANSTLQATPFEGASLGTYNDATPLLIGGEITTLPVVDGLAVNMYYTVSSQTQDTISIPWVSNNGSTSGKWQSVAGTDISTGLPDGDYTVTVRYSITSGGILVSDITGTNNETYTASFTISGNTGIEDATVDGNIVSTQYYTLTGVQVAHPDNGLFVKKTTYDTGTVLTEKVILK